MNFHQQDRDYLANLHPQHVLLLEKCNYPQCYMKTHKEDFSMQAVKYLAVCS